MKTIRCGNGENLNLLSSNLFKIQTPCIFIAGTWYFSLNFKKYIDVENNKLFNNHA